MDYKNSGVDIEAGYKSVELMKEHVKKTMRKVRFFKGFSEKGLLWDEKYVKFC